MQLQQAMEITRPVLNLFCKAAAASFWTVVALRIHR